MSRSRRAGRAQRPAQRSGRRRDRRSRRPPTGSPGAGTRPSAAPVERRARHARRTLRGATRPTPGRALATARGEHPLVLLVPDDHLAAYRDHAVALGGRLPVADHQSVAEAADGVEHATHGQPVHLPGQPEQTGTLGDHRSAGTGQLGDRDAEPPVGGELLDVRLGQGATDHQRPGAGRQRLVGERVHRHHVGPRRPQQFDGLDVAEGATGSAGHRDDRPWPIRGRRVIGRRRLR